MNKQEALRLQVLKILGLEGALHDFVPLTSRWLGERLEVSQQTASRYILALLEDGMIERQLRVRTQMIKLAPTGVKRLKREFADYRQLFKRLNQLQIRGTIISGLGEGKYYIGQPRYQAQFQETLWFKPYEGTLNIKLLYAERHKIKTLVEHDGIVIEGFQDPETERTFGDVKCFLARIRSIECAIVMPARSHYRDVIEVIAPVHLRSALDLEDGDTVDVSVLL